MTHPITQRRSHLSRLSAAATGAIALFIAIRPQPCPAQAPEFIRGADLSTLYQLEAAGAVFTEERVARGAMEILRGQGMNLVRLRLWHTPPGGVNGLAETLAMAQRIEEAGLAFLLDFHYSDTWADPGRQTKPGAWNGLSFDVLQDSVEAYTYDVVAALKAQGTLPEMVQLGNEIIGGMLWPEGRVNSDDPAQWESLGVLLNSARRGLDAALEPADQVEVMIHIDRGGSYSTSQWFFDHLIAEGVEFDVIGQSFYPWWHGTLSQLEANLNALAQRYEKDIVLAEVAYPFTLLWDDEVTNRVGLEEHVSAGYPASSAGQQEYLEDLRTIVEAVPGGRGRGYVYWEPAWIAWKGSSGSPWENVGLFNFGGEVQPAATSFFGISGVASEPTLPSRSSTLQLISVAPNPADGMARVHFRLSESSAVRIRIYNLLGRKVADHHTTRAAGIHSMELPLFGYAPGLYVYRLDADAGAHATGRLVVR